MQHFCLAYFILGVMTDIERFFSFLFQIMLTALLVFLPFFFLGRSYLVVAVAIVNAYMLFELLCLFLLWATVVSSSSTVLFVSLFVCTTQQKRRTFVLFP